MIPLNRGLYLVRYAVADSAGHPSRVSIAPAPGDAAVILFVLGPDQDAPVLCQAGDSLVVQATAPARLVVTITAAEAGASISAAIRIEALGRHTVAPGDDGALVTSRMEPAGIDVSDFQLVGHLGGVGDVTVRGDGILTSPDAPTRIEGISLSWPGKPADMTIRYAVRVADGRIGSPNWVGLGSFAGTRGQARPLTMLIFELSGPGAATLYLFAEAQFFQAPPTSARGKYIVLSGPTGQEGLIGLRLRIEETNVRMVRAPAPPDGSIHRIRVFRQHVDINT